MCFRNSGIGYISCLQHLENKLIIDPENKDILCLYALTLDSLGCYSMNLGRIDDAINWFRKTHKTSVYLYGEVFQMNIVLLNNLANLSCAKKKFNKALFYLKKAEQIAQYLPDKNNFSMIYISFGCIYLQKGMLR